MLKISGLGLRAACVLVAALGVSVSAEAATISLNTDAWKLADNQGAYTVAGVTASAAPLSALAYDAKNGLAVAPVTPATFADLTLADGAVTPLVLPAGPVSVLTLSFAMATPVQAFTALPGAKGTKGDLLGYYSVNGGAWQSLIAANNGQGAFDVLLGQTAISTLAFAANPSMEQGFWVRSLNSADAASVAEPTSMALVGMGLLFGAARLRRRR